MAQRLEDTAAKAQTAVALGNVLKKHQGKLKKSGPKGGKASDEIGGNEETIDELTAKIKELEAKVAECNKCEEKKKELEKIVNEQEAELSEMDKSLAKMEKREKKLLAQLQDLKTKDHSNENSQEIRELRAQVEDSEKALKMKTAELEKTLEDLARVEQKAIDLEQANESLREDREKTKRSMQEGSSQRISELESRVRELEKGLQDKTRDIELQKRLLSDSKVDKKTLEDKVQLLEKEASQKERSTAALSNSRNKEKDVLEQLIADLRLDVERLSSQCKTLESEVKEKDTEIQKLEENMRQLRSENKHLLNNVNEMQNRHLGELKTSTRESDSERKMLIESKIGLDQKFRDLENREGELLRMESNFKLKSAELESQLDRAEQAKSREVRLSTEIDGLNDKIARLEDTIRELTIERNKLRNKNDLTSEEMVSLRTQNELLSRQIGSSAFNQQKLYECQHKHCVIESKYDNLINEVILLKSENETLRHKLTSLKDTFAKKDRDHSKIVHQTSKQQVEFNNLYYEVEGLRAENRALKRALNESKEERDAARHKIGGLIGERSTRSEIQPKPIVGILKKSDSSKQNSEGSGEQGPRSKYSTLYDEMLSMQDELDRKERLYQIKFNKM